MKPIFSLFAVMSLSVATPACAHRLDEYLQAATFAVDGNHVAVEMRLTPGVEVLGKVLAVIDTNGDGVISESEHSGYAERVRRDLLLTIDNHHLQLRLVSSRFPKLEEMKEGLGDILLNFEADVPRGGPNRRLIFENHHQNAISVYLANCLVPRDPNIHVTAQDRNYDQSFYRLDYTQAGVRSPRRPPVLGQFSADGLPSTRGFLRLFCRQAPPPRSRLQEVGCVARETARSDQANCFLPNSGSSLHWVEVLNLRVRPRMPACFRSVDGA